MGQLHCLPEVPAGSSPLAAPVPFLVWKERLLQAQRSRLEGLRCIVTEVRGAAHAVRSGVASWRQLSVCLSACVD
eukprot:COSAG06_NODE_860_length_11903_cov_3.097170_14_plen_75_part_00